MNSVLIIDDDKELCALMKKCVEQENLSAVVAHGGLEGLRLLEENSMEDLEKKNRKYIQLQVSDVHKTSLILEQQFRVTDYAVQDEHNLRLYDTALDMAAINKALVVQDVAVISSQICNDTLEDYFKQITGGEGIA